MRGETPKGRKVTVRTLGLAVVWFFGEFQFCERPKNYGFPWVFNLYVELKNTKNSIICTFLK